MTTQENQALWDEISRHHKELNVLRYKMSQLSIEEQIATLKYAYSIDDEKAILEHIARVEPVEYRGTERKLTIGLLDLIVSGAVYPGYNELEAQKLVIGLVKHLPEYDSIVYQKCVVQLDEADLSDDYEVYQRVYDLLTDIESNYLVEFLKRCEEHRCEDVREIVQGSD